MEATRTSLHGNLPTLSRLRVRRDLADSLQMASSGLHERHFATVNFRTRSENRLNPCATRSNEPKSPHVFQRPAHCEGGPPASDLRIRI